MKTFYSSNYKHVFKLIIFSHLVLVSCQGSKNKEGNKYEQFLSELNKKGQFNGNALIVENGEITYQGAFGIGNNEPLDSLNLNSVFRLGSITKTFTAMGIMILKEEGKLNYEQDITDFIPELPYQGITIKNLLNHVSGLPDFSLLMDTYWKPNLENDDPLKNVSGNEDVVKMLAEKQVPKNFQTLEKWEYSNTGYLLLASIISRASGMTYAKYLEERIFKQANMNHTVVYDYIPGPDAKMPNRVYGFKLELNGKDRTSTDAHYLNFTQGEGGIYSTIGDLFKWDRILYTEKLISNATKKEAFTPAVLKNGETTPYGYGWFIEKSHTGQKVVQHSGGWAGFITYLYREIDDENTIILLSNNSTKYYTILECLKNILHNKPIDYPKIPIYDVIGKTTINDGAEAAINQYQTLKTENNSDYIFGEHQLLDLGWALIEKEKIKDALELFRLNLKEYPNSANTYASLGLAYLMDKDTINSLKYLKTSVSMDSTFLEIKEQINEIEGNSISNKN